MAKKKQEDPPKGSPAWMATFSDLMNLLLCFFVLLFSMSSVDASKWEQVVASMTSAFSIFSDGSMSIGTGTLVGVGTSQLSNLDEYYSTMGQSSQDHNEDDMTQSGSNSDGNQDGTGRPGNSSSQTGTAGNDNSSQTGSTGNNNETEKAGKSLEQELAEANFAETGEMLDTISELTERYNISDDIAIDMDKNGKYVELTVSGSLLFESGSAELKKDCIPMLSKIGDILRVYSKHDVEIIGHTDNVPMKSSVYADNDHLSSARAISAAQYLVKEKNIDVERLSWTGRGEYDPIDTNSTAEGRARNRRIEIRIYNSLSSN